MLPFPPVAATVEPLRRCVRRVRLRPDEEGTYTFRAHSFTRRYGRSYRCRVNPHTGRVDCTCPDFRYRIAHEDPRFPVGPFCKHLRRAVRTVEKAERD